MYAEGSGVVEKQDEASPQAIPVAKILTSELQRLDAISKSEEFSTEQQESDKATDGVHEELTRFRSLFSELKQEVDGLERSLGEAVPARCRGISLQILKERISSVIEQGEIAALKSRVLKSENALLQERHHVFQLEEQLNQIGRQETTMEAARSRLLEYEKEVAEWKSRHDNAQEEISKLTAQLEQQTLEHQSLHRSIAEANANLASLQERHAQSMEDNKAQMMELEHTLEQGQRAQEKLTDRNQHLEKLVMKLSQELENATATQIDDTRAVEENKLTAEQIVLKPSQLSLPDPPLDETLPKASDVHQDSINTALEEAMTREAPLQGTSSTVPEDTEVDSSQTRELPSGNEDHAEARWSWNVAGLWEYVTGESN